MAASTRVGSGMKVGVQMKAHWWQCRDAGAVGWGPTESLRRSRGRTRADEGGARRGGADQIGRDASWRPIACGSGLAGLAGGLAAAVLWVAASLHVTRRASGPRQAAARVRLRPERGSACELLRFIPVAARGPGVGAWERGSVGAWERGRARVWVGGYRVDEGQTSGDRRAAERGQSARARARGRGEGAKDGPGRSPEGARKEQGRRMEGAEGDLRTPAGTQQPRRRRRLASIWVRTYYLST
jgi:hypothetical protein